ncbi:MAG: peptidyl-prolyl cis-trans isomerase [bacterium]
MKKRVSSFMLFVFAFTFVPVLFLRAAEQEEKAERIVTEEAADQVFSDQEIFAPAQDQQQYQQQDQQQDQKKQNRWLIDTILVRVNGVNILKSALEEPRISKNGGSYSLDELIEEELLFQKAAERQIMPSAADIQRQVVAFKVKNDLGQMSDAEFEKELEAGGFTLAMYKKQMGRIMAVENVRRIETDEKIVITSQQVEAYYKKHPVYEKEAYKLKKALLAKADAQDYKKLIEDNKLEWKDLGWIEKESLDKRYSFVSDLKAGDISEPVESGDSMLIFKLEDRKERALKTLDASYSSIERKLREKKRDTFLSNLIEDLKSSASITFLGKNIAG